MTLILGLVMSGWSLRDHDIDCGAERSVQVLDGSPRHRRDGAFVAADGTNTDHVADIVTLDSVYDSDTRTSSWQLTMVPMRTEHANWQPRAGRIDDAYAAERYEVR